MRYHIVEPHADDAFLSLHGHIKRWLQQGSGVTIHTLIPVNRKSLQNAAAYAHKVGADWEGYQMGRLVKDWTPLRDVEKQDTVVLPLALKHPDHKAVLEVAGRYYKGPWYYLDQPYAMTAELSDAVTQALQDKRVISYLRPHASKYNLVKLFDSQNKFFYFNPPEKLKATFEMVVRSAR